jgi:hypothetical protein
MSIFGDMWHKITFQCQRRDACGRDANDRLRKHSIAITSQPQARGSFLPRGCVRPSQVQNNLNRQRRF